MKSLIRSHSSTYCSYTSRLVLVGPIVFDTPCSYDCGSLLADCFAVTESFDQRNTIRLAIHATKKGQPSRMYIRPSVASLIISSERLSTDEVRHIVMYGVHRLGTG
jgi:hypothetical protein